MKKEPPPRSVAFLRPDGLLVWLTGKVGKAIGAKPGHRQLTREQMDHPELVALLHSRLEWNKRGNSCSLQWHKDNGYA